ncbi:hypothetical protein CBL_07406 [Carabus blaptoides fortunei]
MADAMVRECAMVCETSAITKTAKTIVKRFLVCVITQTVANYCERSGKTIAKRRASSKTVENRQTEEHQVKQLNIVKQKSISKTVESRQIEEHRVKELNIVKQKSIKRASSKRVEYRETEEHQVKELNNVKQKSIN